MTPGVLTWQDWLGIAGFAVGILGLVMAYWQWKGQRVESEPVYRSTSYGILGQFARPNPLAIPPSGDLKLTYRGQEIQAATRTFFAIWNRGKKTLEKTAILPDDPLRLEIADGVFLGDPVVIASTRSSIQFKAEPGPLPNVILLTFEFLDQGDGALVEVLHSSPRMQPDLQGDFKASRPPRRDGNLYLHLRRSFRDRMLLNLISIFSFAWLRRPWPVLYMLFMGSTIIAVMVSVYTEDGLLGVLPLATLLISLAAALVLFTSWLDGIDSGGSRRKLPRALRGYPVPPLDAPTEWKWVPLWVWRQARQR